MTSLIFFGESEIPKISIQQGGVDMKFLNKREAVLRYDS
jgi:hypothetical protein